MQVGENCPIRDALQDSHFYDERQKKMEFTVAQS